MIPTHVFFDCDGTLFNTERLKAQSWAAAILSLLEIEDAITDCYRAGGTTRDTAERLARRCTEDFFPKASRACHQMDLDALIARRAQEKERVLAAAFAQELESPPGKGPLLRQDVWRLAVEASNRCQLGLVTVSQPDWVRRYFAASRPLDAKGRPVLDPEAFFRPMVCGLPKRDGIARAVAAVAGVADFGQVTSEQRRAFLIFEDSLDGVRQAKVAGISVVAVPNRFSDDPQLPQIADLLIREQELSGLTFKEVLERVTS